MTGILDGFIQTTNLKKQQGNKLLLLRDLRNHESVDKFDAYNKQRDDAMVDFQVLWHNPELEYEEAHLSISDYLLSLFNSHEVVEIKATKKDLNKIINWSSSKFNEYKKSEFVEIALREHARNNIKYTSQPFTSGSYGAGATGNARSNYGIKGTGGEYVIIAYGLNTYIFDGNTVHSFASNSEFVPKPSLSPSCVEFKNKLSEASKEFDTLWPVKDLDSDFSN
jgi:hypothetical protein